MAGPGKIETNLIEEDSRLFSNIFFFLIVGFVLLILIKEKNRND